MSEKDFKAAVDSLADFPKMVGVMGGEPLLHPKFKEFCAYLHTKVPPERCGLWSSFPEGKEHLAPVIAKTFGNVLLNDHTLPELYHAPVLVCPGEVLKMEDAWYAIHHCWLQNSWSGAVTPKGAYFCEIAAALDLLLNGDNGWLVEPGWWKKTPKDYVSQMSLCEKCGVALAFSPRLDTEGIDDICPWWKEKLNKLGSPKYRGGKCQLFKGRTFDKSKGINSFRANFAYATRVASRYGLYLTVNPNKYLKPNIRRSA